MTTSHYLTGCETGSQAHGNTSAVWVVDFNNGNVNDNNRNNDCCVRAVRSGEYHGAGCVTLRQLHAAWREARRGKKPSLNQMAFDARWADGLLELQRRLRDALLAYGNHKHDCGALSEQACTCGLSAAVWG
ncbi:MAG: hypothetical protein AB7E72_16170 [Lysobacterales bacterium]